MTYTEAIRMALSGDEQGYTFLYEETYKSKMYLAIQYMKNEDDAMDILQDAYVKAFAKLDTLQDPEKFPSWFGMIVANTAKNALVKKNPVLFTDMAADPDAEPFEYSIEDENLSHQPELSYTSEETRFLVREMMDALSEEQRVCVLMFHIDGIPIKEIAETLGCSENTVKSRLNYARKNIKKQGEELQKKGYQLYEIAPFTLLLLLLHKDASAMSGEADFLAAGAKVEQAVFQNGSSFAGESAASSVMGDAAAGEGASAGTSAVSSAAGNAVAGTAAKTAAGVAVKSAFLSTVAGKITIGVIGAALIGGAAFGASQVVQNNQDRSTPTASIQEADGTGTLSSETVPETVSGVAVETESELETEWETLFETELLLAETEVEAESVTETESETESETMAETESESETETELSTELQTEFLTEFETELQTETDTETESEIQTVVETETETESESESETESETESESETENESETETIAETESEDTPVVQAVSFDEFPDLLEGNLTKEELEFVYAYRFDGATGYSVDEQYFDLIDIFCASSLGGADILTYKGERTITYSKDDNTTGNIAYQGFPVDELNRLLSICVDFQLTEGYVYDEDFKDGYPAAYVEGDTFWLRSSINRVLTLVDITEALIIDDELILYCDISYSSSDKEPYSTTFTLQKNEDGKFQFARSVSSDTESGAVISEETETEVQTETETEAVVSVRQVSDDEYADLLEGSLTKEEMEFVLTYASTILLSCQSQGYDPTIEDYCDILENFCRAADEGEFPLTVTGYLEEQYDGDYEYTGYSVAEIDRLFSIFTDFQFDQGDFYSPIVGITVDGDTLWYGVVSKKNYTYDATITASYFLDDQMVIEFELCRELINASSGEVTATYTDDLKAILEQKEDGKYQIVRVISGDSDMYMYTGDETESENTAEIQTIEDDSYLASLKGNLTKEELEFVLSQLRTGTSDFYDETSSYSQTTGRSYISLLCWKENTPLESMGKDGDNMYGFYADEVNRLFSVFTDYQITEENDEDYDYSELQYHKEYDVDGDVLWLLHHVFHTTSEAAIGAVCEVDDMLVAAYTYHYVKYSSQTEGMILEDLTQTRIALLEKDSDGLYRIVYNAPDYTASIEYPELKDVIEALAEIQADTAALEPETAGMETETESESVSAVQTATDDEYPDLLEGELTKEELEYVLAYVSDEMKEGELTDEKCSYLLYIFCSTYMDPKYPLTRLGYGADYSQGYLADELNRLFSVFTDYRITEANSSGMVYMASDTGDSIWLFGITLNYDATATITETLYSENEMIVYYDLAYEYAPEAESVNKCESKAAVLEKNANGNFQIVRITDAASVSREELYASSSSATDTDGGTVSDSGTDSEEEIVMIIGEDTGSTADTGMTDEIRALYEQVLQDVADGKYSFPSAAGCNIEGYYYFVTDMDGDDSPELVVGVQYTHDDTDVFYWHDCLVFDVEAGSLVQIGDDIELLSVFLPADGSCFYAETWLQRGTGMAYIDQVTLQDGVLQSDSVYEMNIQDDAYTQFKESNPLAEWTEISDLTGLDNVQ